MRNRFLLLLFFSGMATLVWSQADPVQHFIDQHRQQEGVNSFDMSGFAIDFTVSGDNPKQEQLLRKLSRLRVFSLAKEQQIDYRSVMALRQALQANYYESLFQLRKGKEMIDILIRENRTGITHAVLLITGEDQRFTLLELQGLFQYGDLRELDLEVEGGEALSYLPTQRPGA